MDGFWPEDITVPEVGSPRDIMQRAGEELNARTKVLEVTIRETALADRVVLAFVVKNVKYGNQFNLFEATHQPQMAYPIVIVPPAIQLPDYLKRERWIPGSPGFLASAAIQSGVLGGTPDKIVKNEWVCGTPDEFTQKLKKLFTLDSVKSVIVGLQSTYSVQEPKDTSPVQEVEPESSGEQADLDSAPEEPEE